MRYGDTKTNLLHHSPRFKLVAVGKTSNQTPLAMAVDPQSTGLALGSAQCLTFGFDTITIILAGFTTFSGRIPFSARASMASASLLSLAIEQEIAENSARTPEKPVCPTFNSAFILVKDKN